MNSSLQEFAKKLARQHPGELDTAIALLWFFTRGADNTEEVDVTHLAGLMHELGLAGKVNVARLRARLVAHRDVMKGRKSDTFRIKLAKREALEETLAPLANPSAPKISDSLLASEDFRRTRRYLEALALQINGTYQMTYYDACAVLCRRLTETLLIEAFEVRGKAAAIKKDADYLPLGEIINIAKGGSHFRLARGTGKFLEALKGVGDAAAHHRSYITKQADIDDLKLEFRRVVAELLHLAQISSGVDSTASAA